MSFIFSKLFLTIGESSYTESSDKFPFKSMAIIYSMVIHLLFCFQSVISNRGSGQPEILMEKCTHHNEQPAKIEGNISEGIVSGMVPRKDVIMSTVTHTMPFFCR